LPLLYTIGRLTVGSALAYGWRPHVEGLEHVPRTGGVIFAGNHLSVADELFIGATVPRHLAFWAKSDYFEGTGIRGWFSRNLMNGLGAIPVERKGGRAALEAFDGAVPVLQGGDAVVIYPEGTRSPDGKLYRGRTGAARLAVAAGVPIVPVGTLGTDKVQPIGRMYPKFSRGTVTIKFGKPIETVGHPEDRTSLRTLTDHLMSEIQKLTGQEYVPTYATAKPSKDT
jgi:1-acyl-sn-glycerol-3-phosphate acyltransferase